MSLGPVEFIVIGFPGNKFKGDILPALGDLVSSGLIRIMDLAFVKKDADGSILAFEFEELATEEAEAFGDKGMVVQLEDMVRDETGHSEETQRILRDWPL